MSPTSPRKGPRRSTLLILVAAALVVNAGLGFLQIATRASVQDQSDTLRAVVACQERYNRASGLALAERDDVFRQAGRVERDLWREYDRLYRLASKDPTKVEEAQAAFYDAVSEYRTQLRRIAATRDRNPYPNPDMCRKLVP